MNNKLILLYNIMVAIMCAYTVHNKITIDIIIIIIIMQKMRYECSIFKKRDTSAIVLE